MLNKIINYFLENRLITILLLITLVVWGLSTAPFDWHKGLLPRNPVPVDAIPDIGENQQIVATEWMGRSPKDIQDQVTYPLTTSLLGISGVKTIRSTSMFGMSFIYIIFNDDAEFYWSRSRILEKLNSLPAGTLPAGVQPSLGPDATALGQIFWYTLEGRDPETGKPVGGWDPDELRTVQDFYVKYSLSSAEGVAEVASAGGFVKEYQVEINPNAMRAFNVSVMDVMNAVQKSNLDIGAETIEVNQVEYLIRGLGYIKNISDLEEAVITVRNNVPVKIKDVAFVNLGPATRRGGLDKEGVEAVGGVVVARYGSNPMQVIDNVKEKIKEMEAGLPQKILPDGTTSKVSVVPFYDRSGLIRETIGTLETALSHEILICIIVVIVLIFNLRASVVIAAVLPIAVLSTFIIMRYVGVEANIVALSGIAIAIGVMVDVGVVFVENIIRHIEEEERNAGIPKGKVFINLIYKSVSEVSGAMTTAMLTTIVSFLPVFVMEAQEGKLFKPLAYTKTFALISAFLLGIALLPTLAYYVFSLKIPLRRAYHRVIISKKILKYVGIGIALSIALYYLTVEWLPLGTQKGLSFNLVFVAVCIALILAILWALVVYYEHILRWCLAHRWKFMSIPFITVFFGIVIWLGFDKTFGFVAKGMEVTGWKTFKQTGFWQAASNRFPGIGEEFMPSLNEGSFLLMPTSMPHTGVAQNLQYIELLDKRISNIPEVEITVGKWGRVNSALDPAPAQMFENTINYRSEYILDEDGRRQRFKVNKDGAFLLKDGSTYHPEYGFRLIAANSLIPDHSGDYFRQWRSHIKKTDDIWQEIIHVSHIPGITSSPKLQPIEARLVMLSTGMRAPMGLKVSGPDLESIEEGGKALEVALKEVPSVLPSTVFYDRAVGAPYIEIKLNRRKMARYGITVSDLQEVINAAVGGMSLTTTVEGRERFPVRLRYPRELRDNPEALSKLIVPTATGVQIPLEEVVDIAYTKGAQMIQSENTFLLGYVIFDKVAGKAEVDVVKEADKTLKRKISSGEVRLPKGVSYKFAGNYEQQERATNRLLIVIPLSLLIILLILYFRFKTITASFIHFSGVFVAFAGGFILLWLYGEPWFMNFSVGGINLRDLFQMHPVNLSIAVWVGFIALFGIATDDGVLMGSYIHQTFLEKTPQTKDEIREAVVHAGLKRVRPAAMTTATALIALLPVLTSTGKGADIMIPMAIPTFGGMLIQSMTMFVVPVLQCWWREGSIRKKPSKFRSRFSLKCLILLIPLILTGNNLFGQNADSLNHYLEVAARNNPGVKADFLAYQASLQKLPQVSAYQDPQLEIGFFLKPMEIIEGRQVANVQFMQMFPWFGTKRAARTEALHMAKMAFEKFRETRDNLYVDVYVQWFTLCRIQQRLMNNRENKELLMRLEELAMRKFSSPTGSSGSSLPVSTAQSSVPVAGSSGMSGMPMGGNANSVVSSSAISSMGMSGNTMSGVSSGMSDILRIRLEMVELDNRMESILSEMEAEKARFNVLLNRSMDSEISVPESLEPMPFLWDATSIIARIADRNPMLGMINEEELAYKAKAEMDKKMSYPMLGIGLQYTFINKNKSAVIDDMGSSGMNGSSMNGKDMIMPMLSFSVPVYRSKYKAQQRETNLRRQESREKYTNTFRLLEAELYKMKHQLDDASRKSILYKKQLELAQTTYHLMVQEFVSGTSDLTNVIQVQRQLLDYQLKNVEAIADYNIMAASIQKLISFKDTE